MVSESLRNLLVGEMSLVPAVNVTILAPDESGGGNRRVNLFLYKIEESDFLKNLDWQASASSPGQLTPPPLSLSLYYLLTAYAQNDPQTGNSTAHEILGDAMRVFYEAPVVPGDYLASGLSGAREQIRVMLNTIDPEELSRVWSTFTEPYRPSVLYEVSMVQIDMLPAAERPIPARVTRIGVPDVRAPFAPPKVHSIDPISGPAGTLVTVRGENLNGWLAYVSMLGSLVLEAQEISGDEFTMAIPNGLPQGFHEVRVDISHMHRSTLFFQVT